MPPLETYRADAVPDPSSRLFYYALPGGIIPPMVVGNANGVHGSYVWDFLRHPGAGFSRIGPPPSPSSTWTELVAVSSDGDHTGDGAIKYDPVSEKLTLSDGTQLERHERVWLLQEHQLMGLVVAPEPVVYKNSVKSSHELLMQTTPVLKNQHDLMKSNTDGATAPKRALDGFETEALEKLRGGDEVALRSSDTDMRMLGAIRARKDCQSCHKVEVGHLLGAFSYTLKLQSEETPAEHKLADLAGLTDRERAAVRAIEAVGGKVIRTPGGPVTELKMTFARNEDMAIKRNGSYSTRLMLRDSALSHLLAFPDLTAVDVSKSLVSDAGLKTLADLKNLKRLNVQHTSTTPAGVAELKKALPGCEVAATPPPVPAPAPRPR